MARKRQVSRSFTGGELSPLMHGRVDLVPYRNGLALSKNFVTLPQGPAKFRPGTEFHQYAFFGSPDLRLIPFVFSDEQAYWIELDANKLRIHTFSGTLLDDAADFPALINPATGPNEVFVSFEHIGATNAFVYLESSLVPEVNGRWYYLSYIGTAGVYGRYAVYAGGTDVTGYRVDMTGWGTDTTTGRVHFALELVHGFGSSLPLVRYAQSADVLTLVSPNAAVATLRRTGPNDWSLVTEVFAPEIAAPTGITATAGGGSAGTPVAYYYVATAIPVDGSSSSESLATAAATASQDLTVAGQYIDISLTPAPPAGVRYNVYKALNGLYGFIGQTGGASFRDNNIIPDLSISPPEYGPDFTGAGNYPRAVTYHQQRKWFAGSINAPQTLWATRTGTENDMSFTIPSRDDNALEFAIASREVQTVQSLVPLRDLLVLTSGGVWKVRAANSDVLTPSSASADLVAYAGSTFVQPVTTESAVLFALARGGRVGEIRYTEEASDYAVNDLSLLSSHLFDGFTIKEMAIMDMPTRIVWILRSDGKLLSLSYQPEHKVVAWHQHELGAGATVQSICVVPGPMVDGRAEDVLVAAVARTREGAGAAVTYLELLSGFGDLPDLATAQKAALYLDGAQIYDGPPATQIIGLWALEGFEVRVVADGAVHPPVTIENGTLELEAPASRVITGLSYVGRMETLPVVLENVEAEGQGILKSVSRVVLRLYQSSGVFVGPDFDTMDELKARSNEPYDTAPRWKTGEFEIVLSPTWGRLGNVCIEQRDPMPLVLLGMVADVELGD